MKSIFSVCAIVTILCGFTYPDKGGVADFDNPQKIKNQLLILTNPRTGSHLLLYSIVSLTQRPLRGRVPMWHFLNDPPFRNPENILRLDMDFSKPTMYWGHEYHLLGKLNHSNNKLIFTSRNYKETILSNLKIQHGNKNASPKRLEKLLQHEIINGGSIFAEYINRLRLYDRWDPSNRLLVKFEHLVKNPEIFVPAVLSFIQEPVDPTDFISNYSSFKQQLRDVYDAKKYTTVSRDNVHYFGDLISPKTHAFLDNYVKSKYPKLWNSYLHEFEYKK
ncbi:MAG: sulfotransferase domain-containing protein [Chlamydiales bacterium]|nr:sulfotransferase domain-containing protein [Chlamydiales bacterium]